MRESKFQSALISELKDIFDDCIILKNDANYVQGIPDLIILFNDRWAALEVKASRTAPTQPNQKWWIDKMNKMSYASTVWPEIKDTVIDELQFALRPGRQARVSKRV